MTRVSGGNLARTPGLHPTLYEKCHGIFNDHRESGPRFNVSSERRLCKNISLLSIRSGIDLKIRFFYFSPGKAYSTPLTTDQKQFSSVRNPYMPRGREV